MNSVASMSTASGLTVMTLAGAKNQNIFKDLSAPEQAQIAAAPTSIVINQGWGHFQATLINSTLSPEALNMDATLISDETDRWGGAYAKYDTTSSGELSDALYAGVNTGFGTFEDYVSQDISSSQRLESGSGDLLAWVAAGRPNDPAAVAALDPYASYKWSDAEMKTWTQGEFTKTYSGMSDNEVIASANHTIQSMQSNISKDQQMLTAFHDHTLTIQKASDAKGLDYNETEVISESDHEYIQSSESYNESFARENNGIGAGTDGKMHEMIPFFPAMLWVTW